MTRTVSDAERQRLLDALAQHFTPPPPAERDWEPPRLGPHRTVVLSARQALVLDGICNGHTYQALANRHHLTLDTVKTHAQRLFAHLGAHSQGHAAALACTGQLTIRVRGDQP